MPLKESRRFGTELAAQSLASKHPQRSMAADSGLPLCHTRTRPAVRGPDDYLQPSRSRRGRGAVAGRALCRRGSRPAALAGARSQVCAASGDDRRSRDPQRTTAAARHDSFAPKRIIPTLDRSPSLRQARYREDPRSAGALPARCESDVPPEAAASTRSCARSRIAPRAAARAQPSTCPGQATSSNGAGPVPAVFARATLRGC